MFILRQEVENRSPLDVPGVDLGSISTQEVVSLIREGGERIWVVAGTSWDTHESPMLICLPGV